MASLDLSKLTVVSGEGHEYELHESIRLVCALCVDPDGLWYEFKTPGFKADAGNKYLSVKMRLRNKSVKSVTADTATIAKLYRMAEASKSTRQQNDDAVPLEKARREFLTVINAALKERAVDIHFIVREHGVKILFRINGKIEPIDRFSYSRDYATGLLGAIFGETKDSSDQSFSPRLKSSCTIKYEDPSVSIRWQTVPMGDAHGYDYDVVLRVTRQDTSAGSNTITLSDLGYLDDQVELLSAACNSRGGIFMSGVTGSGKTTALRSLMQIVRGTGESKIYSVEDPIELKVFGVSQINVRGGSMAENIKALMRGDPDTIMVGEIRNKEVADALQDVIRSGHKGLTTIHASSALGIVSRLSSESIGVSRDTLAEPGFISCLVYQYLMPVLCNHCKIPASQAYERIEHLAEHLFSADRYALNPDSVYVRNESGCEHCRKGISGMTICAETIRPTDEMSELLRDRRDSEALRQYRMMRSAPFDSELTLGKTSYEVAIYKVSQGILDPNDVDKMCGAMSLERIVRGPYG